MKWLLLNDKKERNKRVKTDYNEGKVIINTKLSSRLRC